MKKNYILISIVALVMLGAVIYGFWQSGSPFETRRLKLDAQRLSHLSSIRSAIQTYVDTNKVLPSALSDLPERYGFDVKNLKDPETESAYEYKVTGEFSYELCAVFSTNPPKKEEGYPYSSRYYDYYDYGYGSKSTSTTYQKGHSCLPYEVRKPYIPPLQSQYPIDYSTTVPPRSTLYNATLTRNGGAITRSEVTPSSTIDLVWDFRDAQNKRLLARNARGEMSIQPGSYSMLASWHSVRLAVYQNGVYATVSNEIINTNSTVR